MTAEDPPDTDAGVHDPSELGDVTVCGRMRGGRDPRPQQARERDDDGDHDEWCCAVLEEVHLRSVPVLSARNHTYSSRPNLGRLSSCQESRSWPIVKWAGRRMGR